MSAMMRGNLRMALSGVRGAKWRSVLTMLGVIVGIVAVVTVVGIGEGVKKQIAGTLEHFGKDLIIVRPGQIASGQVKNGTVDVLFGLSSATSLSVADVGIVRDAPQVAQAAPLGIVPGNASIDTHTAPRSFVLATSSEGATVLNQKVKYGEFWGKEDENANLAVVGKDVAEQLFDEAVPLGRTFSFRGETFIVRGVFDQFLNVPFSPTASFDEAIFIPYKSAARITKGTLGMYAVLAKAGSPEQVDPVMHGITEKLREAHGGQQDFSVIGPKQSAVMGSEAVRLLTLWICAVAIISLCIGGVGIMNIMLLNVTERMHEIGVRKAVGASSRQILGQFLFEAAVLSLIGGVIGIVASLGVIGLLNVYTDLKPIVSWQAVALAVGVSLIVGVVFGTAPAVKAASKDPIEALRHE